MVIEKAKRLVEHKKDVVILLDSITRLAAPTTPSCRRRGKVLTGGVDANALQRPSASSARRATSRKAARLTIVATALIDTGPHLMDEVIVRGVQGHRQHGNPHGSPHGQRRVYRPSILVARAPPRGNCCSRPNVLQKTWILRKLFSEMDEIEAMGYPKHMRETKNNKEFFDAMTRALAIGSVAFARHARAGRRLVPDNALSLAAGSFPEPTRPTRVLGALDASFLQLQHFAVVAFDHVFDLRQQAVRLAEPFDISAIMRALAFCGARRANTHTDAT